MSNAIPPEMLEAATAAMLKAQEYGTGESPTVYTREAFQAANMAATWRLTERYAQAALEAAGVPALMAKLDAARTLLDEYRQASDHLLKKEQERTWMEGQPPPDIEAAWLLLAVDDDLSVVQLGVLDDDGTWSESGDWKCESYRDVIDLPIIGWLPFEAPKAPQRNR